MKLEVICVGGAVNRMKEVGDQLEKLNISDTPVKYTGFLQNDELSIILSSCSLGITPVPRHALGKSGGVAAFLLHEVPVASPNIHPKYKENEIIIGKIAIKMHGEKGFGYDPIFIPDGANKSFAEMTMDEKNKFSHRQKAVTKLFEFLRAQR